MSTVEIEYADGTVARWTLSETDTRIEEAERALGTPDTMRL